MKKYIIPLFFTVLLGLGNETYGSKVSSKTFDNVLIYGVKNKHTLDVGNLKITGGECPQYNFYKVDEKEKETKPKRRSRRLTRSVQ